MTNNYVYDNFITDFSTDLSLASFSSSSFSSVSSEILLGDKSNNLKGQIVSARQTRIGTYISTIVDGVTYFLTMMPSYQDVQTSKGSIGLAFLPVKINSSMRISDISSSNAFGQLYHTTGTMSQSFGIRNTGTNTSPIFNLGYASNNYLTDNQIFSLSSQISTVLNENLYGTEIPLSIFRTKDTIHAVNFKIEDEYNLDDGSLYAGVKYSISFTGELFYIPFYPPVTSTLKNGLATKIDGTKLTYPKDFRTSKGIDTYLIVSTLYDPNNCSVPVTEDPRDVLNLNMRRELNSVIFTNVSDCIVGINYDYCPTGITCSGNCKSSCSYNGNCSYNTTSKQYECSIDFIPLNPILTPLTPISSGIMFWFLLLFLVVAIGVVIAAVYYSSHNSSSDKSSNDKSIELKSIAGES